MNPPNHVTVCVCVCVCVCVVYRCSKEVFLLTTVVSQNKVIMECMNILDLSHFYRLYYECVNKCILHKVAASGTSSPLLFMNTTNSCITPHAAKISCSSSKFQQKWSVAAAALRAVFGIVSNATSYTHLCCLSPLSICISQMRLCVLSAALTN